MPVFFQLLTGLGLALLLAFSHGLLKWVSIQHESSFILNILQHWTVVAAALAIYVIIFFIYIFALKAINISFLYPLYTGLSVLLVTAIGAYQFDEAITGAHIAGSIFILLGILFLAKGSS
jgi:small multidrug resistance pump